MTRGFQALWAEIESELTCDARNSEISSLVKWAAAHAWNRALQEVVSVADTWECGNQRNNAAVSQDIRMKDEGRWECCMDITRWADSNWAVALGTTTVGRGRESQS